MTWRRVEKYLLLLRQYQEEMLDAYLQDTEDFPVMLHYCNIIYEYLPMILNSSHLRGEKGASKLAAIAVVAAGYGGDMDEELANALLDDMDFDRYGKVKCEGIEASWVSFWGSYAGGCVTSMNAKRYFEYMEEMQKEVDSFWAKAAEMIR